MLSFFMGDRNDSKKQKKVIFSWQKFCKHHAKEIANFCGRLFSSADLQKID